MVVGSGKKLPTSTNFPGLGEQAGTSYIYCLFYRWEHVVCIVLRRVGQWIIFVFFDFCARGQRSFCNYLPICRQRQLIE